MQNETLYQRSQRRMFKSLNISGGSKTFQIFAQLLIYSVDIGSHSALTQSTGVSLRVDIADAKSQSSSTQCEEDTKWEPRSQSGESNQYICDTFQKRDFREEKSLTCLNKFKINEKNWIFHPDCSKKLYAKSAESIRSALVLRLFGRN